MSLIASPTRASSSSFPWIWIAPILSDNYSYFLICSKSNKAAVIDPADPPKITQYLSQLKQDPRFSNLSLEYVLTTHKHWDHAGGNEAMAQQFQGITVVGSKGEQIPACNKPVDDGDEFTVGDTLKVKVLSTPCHTRGHIQYLVTRTEGSDPAALFTGDTIFVGGCGRFFEGTAQQMLDNMQKVSKLDPSTEIYCGHEYTLSNLKFAKEKVEPSNADLDAKIEWSKAQRERGLPTIPSTLGEELTYNPFMRAHVDSVKQAAMNYLGQKELPNDVDTMAAIRKMKDEY